jgi:thymidylate synthase (FAD)
MPCVIQPSVVPLHCTPDPERVIESAGRVCWRSVSKDPDNSHVNFIKMIKSKGHVSVLEHASAGFTMVTSRGIGNEIVRHRLASYSQESTRFCCYAKGKFNNEISVIQPSQIPDGSRAQKLWLDSVSSDERAYMALIDEGIPPEAARDVLPLSLATVIVWSANFREWLRILELRDDLAAHPDMRRLMVDVKKHLFQWAPTVFEAYKS